MDDFDLIAEYYDLLYADQEEDLELWLALAERCTGPLLEVGCGTGRLLLPLAEAGHRVTGVDISPRALARARERLASAGLEQQVGLHQADMCAFTLPQGDFALAIVAANSFMHCHTLAEQMACLQSIRRHLTDGGLLVIDNDNPTPAALLEMDGRLQLYRELTDEMTGRRVQWCLARELDLAQQQSLVTFILDEIGEDGVVRRASFAFRMRYTHRFELELLLEKTGFTLQNLYGNYDTTPYAADSPRLIAVAQAARRASP